MEVELTRLDHMMELLSHAHSLRYLMEALSTMLIIQLEFIRPLNESSLSHSLRYLMEASSTMLPLPSSFCMTLP